MKWLRTKGISLMEFGENGVVVCMVQDSGLVDCQYWHFRIPRQFIFIFLFSFCFSHRKSFVLDRNFETFFY